jgi:hypothetical protein
VDVYPNVRIVDPVVTQLVTRWPRPEFGGGCPRSVVRAGAYGSGPTRTPQPAEVLGYSMLYIIHRLIPSRSSTVDESTRESRARAGVRWRECRPESVRTRLVRRLLGGTDMHRQPRRSYAPSKTAEPAPTT